MAKTERKLKILGVERKSTIGEEMGKKRGEDKEDPSSHKGTTRFKVLFDTLPWLKPWKILIPHCIK